MALLGSLAACAAEPEAPPTVRYVAAEYGLAFRYPARLYLQDKQGDGAPLLSLVLIEDEPLHRALLAGTVTEPMESPPMITVDVYANPESLGAAEWIGGQTNWIVADKHPEWLEAGGQSYLVFHWDGLYAGRSAVHAGPGLVYVFSVSWISEQDQLVADFADLLTQVQLTGR